jgi:signal transduction histidine kinase
MSAKKKDESVPESGSNSKDLDSFISDYTNAYKYYLSSLDMDALHLPHFYKGFPYTVEVYTLPNNAVCALFRKSNRSKISILEDSFENIKLRIQNQDFDFLQIFPPFTNFTRDEAERLGRLDAEKDVKASRRLEMLTAAESHLSAIHLDIKAIVELNPWLDQQSEEQKKKLDKAKALIMELYNEVEISKEERFADYSHQLSEAMAFERGEMEEVAGALEIELETALEGMEARLAALEEALDTHQHETATLNKLENNVSELARNLRETTLKLKSIEMGGSLDEMELAMSEAQESLKDNSKKIAGLEKEFDAVKEDVASSKEIKETVFRDSKRTFNLNERVTELERSMSSTIKDAGKTSKSEIKALEGRMNVMEKNLKDYVKKVIQSEMELANPSPAEVIVEESQVPNPAGGTMKRTTKTTTRKTTRSK